MHRSVRTDFLVDLSELLPAQIMKLEARVYKIELDAAYQSNPAIIQYIPDDRSDQLNRSNPNLVLENSCGSTWHPRYGVAWIVNRVFNI